MLFRKFQQLLGAVPNASHLKAEEAAKLVPVLSSPLSDEQEAKPSNNNVDEKIDIDVQVMKGQGYFNLFLFREASEYFERVIHQAPECNIARLFLAMSLMHLQRWGDAERHFRLLVQLTEHVKWQALGLNALGCIQAIRLNLDYAQHYFQKAHETDPSFKDPVNNLKSCKDAPGRISLCFGSTELTCL